MGVWAAVVERITAQLAFFPPRPASYELVPEAGGALRLGGPAAEGSEGALAQCTPLRLATRPRPGGGGGTTLAALWIPHPRARLTVLHSHGNAVDLGMMQHLLRQLSAILQVNVLGYDYSGYGCSSGSVAVRNTLADVEACWGYLTEERGISPGDIILYGQSLGSGPSAWLASQQPEVGGLVLHSGLASGIRVLNPSIRWWPNWADIYPNFKLVRGIGCPTLIMHGTEDDVVHFNHGLKLYECCRNPVAPLFAEGHNHHDLEQSPDYSECSRGAGRGERRGLTRADPFSQSRSSPTLSEGSEAEVAEEAIPVVVLFSSDARACHEPSPSRPFRARGGGLASPRLASRPSCPLPSRLARPTPSRSAWPGRVGGRPPTRPPRGMRGGG